MMDGNIRSDELDVYDCVKEGKPLGFRIYYGKSGGAVYSAVGTLDELLVAWQTAPNHKVGMVVLYLEEKCDNGWNTIHRIGWKDLYSFDGRKFYCGNDSRKMFGRLLFGQWFRKDQIREMTIRASKVRRCWPMKVGGKVYG